MAEVTVSIGGRNYAIHCDDGQESRVRSLAARIDAGDERYPREAHGLQPPPGLDPDHEVGTSRRDRAMTSAPRLRGSFGFVASEIPRGRRVWRRTVLCRRRLAPENAPAPACRW